MTSRQHRPYDKKWFERAYHLARYMGHDWARSLPGSGYEGIPAVPGPEGRMWTPALVEAFHGIYEKKGGDHGPISPGTEWWQHDDIAWALHDDGTTTIELVFSRETVTRIRGRDRSEVSGDIISVLRAEVEVDNTATVERPMSRSRISGSKYVKFPMPFVEPGFPIHQNHFDRVIGALRAIGVVIRSGEARDLARELEVEESSPPSSSDRSRIVLGRAVPI